MLYISELPVQMAELPLMLPGIAGAPFTVTLNVSSAEEPQELSAVTVTLPLVVPAVVLIEVVAEVPVHPPGNVHV